MIDFLPKRYSTQVTSNKEITSNMIELLVTLDKTEFNFKSGQFAFVDIPNTEPLQQRAYSFASSPDELPSLRFWIKFSQNSKSEKSIRAIQIGDQINFKGPYGVFTYRNNSRPKIFIATSSGLAPIYSILKQASDSTLKKLIFGVRNESDLFAQDLLEQLQKKQGLDVSITMSKPNPEWRGLRGRVNTAIEAIPEDLSKFDFYICGSPPMVDDIKTTLLERNVDPQAIYFEKFIGLLSS